MRLTLLGVAIGLLAACATGPATASGRPEITLPALTERQVRDRLIEKHAAAGWTIEKAEDLSVVVAKRSDGFAHMMLAGANAWWRIRFTIVKMEVGTKIFASVESVSNLGSANEQRYDVSDQRGGRDVQGSLERIFPEASTAQAGQGN